MRICSIIIVILSFILGSVQAQNTNKFKQFGAGDGIIYDLCTYHDGSQLAFPDGNKIKVYYLSSANLSFELSHSELNDIRAIDIDKNDELIAAGDKSGNIVIWDLKSREVVDIIETSSGRITSLKFGPSGKYLFAALQETNGILRYDLKNSTQKNIFNAHNDVITDLQINSVKGWIVTSSMDKTIKIWNMEDMEWFNSILGYKSIPRGISVRDDAIYICGDNSEIELWKFDSDDDPKMISSSNFGNNWIMSIDNLSDQKVYAVGSMNGRVKIDFNLGSYTANSAKPVLKVKLIPEDERSFKVVFATLGGGVKMIKAVDMKYKSY